MSSIKLDDIQPIGSTSDNKFAPTTVDLSEVYDYAGAKLGFVSRYPTYSPTRDNEDFYAQQQTGLEKIGNSLATFKNLSLNTFVNHFASYARDMNAITSGDYNKLWDDALGEETARQVLAQSNLNPLYETSAQQGMRDNASGLFGAIKQFVPFTGRAGNAWGNLAGQLGFTVGTIGAVAIETVGLSALTAATGGGAAPLEAGKLAIDAAKIKSIGSVWELLKGSKNLFKVKQVGQELNAFGKVLTSKPLELYRMGIAAQGESVIEANTSALEFKEEQIAKYREQYGVEPPQQFIQEIEDNSIKVGNTTFNWNMPVLLVSNAITIGNLFNPKYLAMAKYAPKSVVADVVKGTKFLGTKNIIQTALKNSPKLQTAFGMSNKVGNFLVKDKLIEGVEEVLQGLGSRAAQEQFDMFESEYGKGMAGFVAAMGDEVGRSAGSNEFWDEFVSGYLTGFGISVGKGAFNKATGVTKAQKEMTEKGIADLTSTYSNWTNLLKQNALSVAKESAVAEGNTKEAKSLIKEAENAFFMELARYGVAEEKMDGIADAMKEMSEKDQKEMLGDRTVDDVVRGLKAGYKEFETSLFTLRKNIQNPHKQGTEDYKTFDSALMIAASVHTNSQDMLKRGKALVTEVQQRFAVEETMISAMIDPTTLTDSLSDIRKLEAVQKESATIESLTTEEKATRQKELSKTQDKIKVLEKLQQVFFDKNGEIKDSGKINASQAVSLILNGMYGSSVATHPKELQDALKDIYELEREGREYLNVYNLLNNKENFQKFGKSFVDTYNNGRKAVLDRLNTVPKTEQAPVTETEKITEEEAETALDEFVGIPTAMILRTAIDEAIKDVTKTADGKYKYGGKVYDDINALFDALKKQTKVSQEELDKENKQGQSVETILKQELNGKEFSPETASEILSENATEQSTESAKEKKANVQVNTSLKPKTKAQKEAEKDFNFINNNKGLTLTHYYDIVLSSIFTNATNILNKLFLNDTKTHNALSKAIEKLGTEKTTTISAIYLADENQIEEALDMSVKEFNDTTEDMQVVYDGIRFWFVTQGDAENARTIIADHTSLVLNGANVTTAVENADGTHIVSGFRKNLDLTETNDAAVHAMKKGDNVNLYLSDKEYNEKAVEEAKKEIAKSPKKKQEILDKLVDRLLIEVKDVDGNLVGVLRAADFLFEMNQKEIKEFRQRIIDNNFNGVEADLGTNIGSTKVEGISTSRNFNRDENGKKVFTNVNEFSPSDRDGVYEKEFFYVTEEGEIINEKGEAIPRDSFEFDRKSFAPTGVYMRITGKNGKNHTVQVVRDNETESGYTRKEFKDGQHLKDGLTDLKNDSPIVSKRLIVSMGTVNEETTTKNDAQGIADKAKEILDSQTQPTSTQSDIEKRREEELKIAKRNFEFLNEDYIPKLEENTNALKEQYNFQKSYLLKNTNDLEFVESKYGKTFEDWIPLQIKWLKENKASLLVDARNSESRDYKILSLLQEKSEAVNKINAKYDAELKALEQQATSTQSEIEAKSSWLDKIVNKAFENFTAWKKAGKNQAPSQMNIDLFESYRKNPTVDVIVNILQQFYNGIRLANYSMSTVENDISNYTEQTNSDIQEVREENGWHYRIPFGSSIGSSKYRFSLNVKGEKALIDALDKLTKEYGIYYKTPQLAADWTERHDPISIYITNTNLSKEQIEELKQKVIEVTKPFIRSNEGFGLYGENISEGVEFGEEATKENANDLINEGKSIDNILGEAIKSFLTKAGTDKVKGSVGQQMAVRDMLNLIQSEKQAELKALEQPTQTTLELGAGQQAIPLPQATRENMRAISKEDREYIENRYGVIIETNPTNGKTTVRQTETVSEEDVKNLTNDLKNAVNRGVMEESAKQAEVISGNSSIVEANTTKVNGYTFKNENGTQTIIAPNGAKMSIDQNGDITQDDNFNIDELITAFPNRFNKPKITVVDKNGNETVLESPKIEGTMIGGISATDISDVKETEEKETTPITEQQQDEWVELQGDPKEAVMWLTKNAKKGQLYRLEDGTEITVTLPKGKGAFAKMRKGDYTFYAYINEAGDILPLLRNKAGNIEVYGMEEEVGETNVQSVYGELTEVDDFVQTLFDSMLMYGVDANVIFNKILDAYQYAVMSGSPITNYEILADAAGLTEEEYFAVQKTLTPIFQQKLMNFMANSETVWNSTAEEAWTLFSQDLGLSLDFLENVYSEGVSKEDYDRELNIETKTLQKIFNKHGIKINLNNLASFPPIKIRELASSLKQVIFNTDYKQAIKDTITVLKDFGLTITAQTLFTVAKVNLNTLGRNPMLMGEVSPNLSMDVAMISQEGEMYVKNEKDGLFVNVPKIKEKVSEEIWKIQKEVLSLTGIKFPVTYLQAYKDLNGDFSALKTRALKHKELLFLPNENGLKEVTDIERVGNNNNVFVSSLVEGRLVYKGDNYGLIMQTNDGKGVYLRDGKEVTAQMYRAIMKDLNVSRTTPTKAVRVANTYSNLKKIKDQQTKITCN